MLLLGLAGEAHRALDDSRKMVQRRYCDAFGQLVDASAAAPKFLPRDRRTITPRPSGGGLSVLLAALLRSLSVAPRLTLQKGRQSRRQEKGIQGEAFP